MALSSSPLGVSVSLHPLPILTISEHLTRARCQHPHADTIQIYGALLGTQNGRDIEIHNTFEIKVDHSSTTSAHAGPSTPPQIDHAFFKSRQAQFKQTFPTFDFLGWYSNGIQPTQADMDIHKQLLDYSEAPVLLQFTPSNAAMLSSSRGGELPLQLYESQVEIAAPASGNVSVSNATSQVGQDQTASVAGPHLYFVKSSYKIQTGEAERIAVDYTSKPSDGGGNAADAGAVVSSLTTQQSAIRMLSDRIQLVLSYITAIRKGRAERDEDVLRLVKSILASMPAMNSPEFRDEFMKEYNDVLLTSFLASMTKGVASLNELVDKFEMVTSTMGGDHSPDQDASGPERMRITRDRRGKGAARP